jgi:Ca2+-binding EF-hand superfamily protein
VSLAELKKRMVIINPSLSEKDIAILTNGKNDIKAKDLYELLGQNELNDFDPLAEAFKLLDPNATGQLDIDRLRQVFKGLGYGDIEKKDLEILNECMDVNKDGKITLEDFRELFDYLGRPDLKKKEDRE